MTAKAQSTSWSKVLQQSPFSGTRPTVEAPATEEIQEALAEIQKKGISDTDGARVAAFAWYSGVHSDTVLSLFRNRGVARVVKDELSILPKAANKVAVPHNSFAFRHFSEYDLAKMFGLPELGWTVAVLSVAIEADFDAVLDCLKSKRDPHRFVSYFLVAQPILPPPKWQKAIQEFLSVGDELSREIVIELLTRWMEITVPQGGVERVIPILADLEKNKTLGPVILGALLENSQRFTGGQPAQEITDRSQALQDAIETAGKKLVIDRKTVNAALQQAGIRDLNVLAAMSKWRADPAFTQAASKAIGAKAKEILDKRFGTHLRMGEEQAALTSTCSGVWSIEPLVQVLAHDGIDTDVFNSYFDGFATDRLSQMTRQRTFLADRQRAIILVAVGAFVANERGDHALLRAAQSAAIRLNSQPSGSVEVIDERGRNELRKLNIVLPGK